MSTSSVTPGSMIDVNSIVNNLMQFEARPLQMTQTKISAANVSISAMGEVKSLVDSAYSAIDMIEDQLRLASKFVAVADNTVIKASVMTSSLAGVGSVTAENTTTASVQRSTFSGFAAIDQSMGGGIGTLSIDIATGSSLLKSDEDPVSLSFDLQGKTLAELRDEINADESLSGKLKAVLINTGIGSSPWVLQLVGTKTGSLASFTATWSADDSVHAGITSADGGSTPGTGPLIDAAGTGANPTPDNASATINGVRVESQTNVFENVVPGIRFEVLKASLTGTTVNITDSRNDLQSKIKSFANAFSDLLLKVKTLTKPGSDSEKAGALAGNSGVLGLSSRLFSAYVEGITLSSGRSWSRPDGTPALDSRGNPLPIRWSQLGLSVQRSGSISLDESTLSSALTGSLGESMLLGFTSSIRSTLATFRGSTGSISTTLQAMQTTVSSLRQDQEKIQDRMQRTRTSLIAKYSALDAKLSQMNQLSGNLKSALAGLSA